MNMGATSASKSRTHVQSETLSIIERKSLPEYAAYIIVRMDAGGLDIPSGKLFNAFLQKPVSFTGLSDMLLKMDQIYDFLDFPQATREDRTFAWKKQPKYDRLAPYQPRYFKRSTPNLHGRAGLTLVVQTRYRQNGSWQGTVRCPQLGKTANYVSALQFLKLTAEAIHTITAKKDGGAIVCKSDCH